MGRKIGMLTLALTLVLPGCGDKYQKSEIIIDDVYRLEDMENIEFAFSKDSTLVVEQKGIYELARDETGEPMVRICLSDISRELPEDYNYTEYLLREEDEHIELIYTSEEFDLETDPMILVPLSGENGLLSGTVFDGTYQMGKDGDSYQYIFKEDGSVIMKIKERYYADKEKMILSDHAGSTEYLYEMSDDTLVLKTKEEESVLTMKKQAD